jgi:hypothetical protein
MEKVVNKTVFSKDGFVSMNKAMVTRNLMSSALLQAVILIGIILSLVAQNWTMLAIFGAMFVIFPILLFVMYQNGIKKVVYLADGDNNLGSTKATKYMFKKCGVECIPFSKVNLENLKKVVFNLDSTDARNYSSIKKRKTLNLKKDNDSNK